MRRPWHADGFIHRQFYSLSCLRLCRPIFGVDCSYFFYGVLMGWGVSDEFGVIITVQEENSTIRFLFRVQMCDMCPCRLVPCCSL